MSISQALLSANTFKRGCNKECLPPCHGVDHDSPDIGGYQKAWRTMRAKKNEKLLCQRTY